MSKTNERALEETIEQSLITSGGYSAKGRFVIRNLAFGIQNKEKKQACLSTTHRKEWDETTNEKLSKKA